MTVVQGHECALSHVCFYRQCVPCVSVHQEATSKKVLFYSPSKMTKHGYELNFGFIEFQNKQTYIQDYVQNHHNNGSSRLTDMPETSMSNACKIMHDKWHKWQLHFGTNVKPITKITPIYAQFVRFTATRDHRIANE